MSKTYIVCADGTNDLMVTASSRKEAATLCGVSEYQMKTYGYIGGVKTSIEVANSRPGKVWTRKTCTREPWRLVESDDAPVAASATSPHEPMGTLFGTAMNAACRADLRRNCLSAEQIIRFASAHAAVRDALESYRTLSLEILGESK